MKILLDIFELMILKIGKKYFSFERTRVTNEFLQVLRKSNRNKRARYWKCLPYAAGKTEKSEAHRQKARDRGGGTK